MVVQLRKILLPLKERVDAGEIVAALSQLEGGNEVTLFHVVKVPITTPLGVEVSTPEWLKSLAEELRKSGMNVRVVVAEARDVASAIVEEAEEGKYDLIIMFKKKKKGLERVVGRSISEKVAEETRRPVMTILRE